MAIRFCKLQKTTDEVHNVLIGGVHNVLIQLCVCVHNLIKLYDVCA